MRYVRDGLASAIATHSGMEVVASVALASHWQSTLRSEKPDIVVVSADRSDADRLVAEIAGATVNSRIVAHGQTDDDEREVLAWALAGAHGFVAQQARDVDITSVVECVARGEVRYATSFAHVVVNSVVRSTRERQAADRVELLTRREHEILTLLGQHTNKEIAFRLGVEVPTVKSHVHKILAKLGVQRRRDAVRFRIDPV